jgi:prevent-host-death family protein
MRQVTIHAAKTHLSRLIAAAAGGEEIVIARGGTPVARLVPVVKSGFKIGMLKGKLRTGPDFLEPMPEADLDLWQGGR